MRLYATRVTEVKRSMSWKVGDYFRHFTEYEIDPHHENSFAMDGPKVCPLMNALTPNRQIAQRVVDFINEERFIRDVRAVVVTFELMEVVR